jgi:hypothetical protein
MSDKYNYLYIYILLLALIYNIINNFDIKTLVSIIIIFIVAYIFYMKIINDKKTNKIEKESIENNINSNLNDFNKKNSLNLTLSKIPNEFKYLLKDEVLTKLVLDIQFIKKFNKSLYLDILIQINKIMKLYIYILSDIYEPKIYIKNIIDLKKSVIDLLESSKLIIPLKYKHLLNINMSKIIDNTIELFKIRITDMLSIIANYSKHHNKDYYIYDNIYIDTYNSVSNKNDNVIFIN